VAVDRVSSFWILSAAPHLPAGIFSPLNGEQDVCADDFANHRRRDRHLQRPHPYTRAAPCGIECAGSKQE
jgi:hypothetical protein